MLTMPTTKSGAVYKIDGAGDFININFCDDRNEKFNYTDLKEIIKTECPHLRPKDIRISAHSGAGITISHRIPHHRLVKHN